MTREEAEVIMANGAGRTAHHNAKGTKHRYGLARSAANIEQDRLGALAEATVAEYLGLPWTSKDNGKPDDGVDVGDCVGVRHTTHARGCIIIHPEDRDDVYHVLVVGSGWPLRIVGWQVTGWCKQARFWRADVRYPAWFVPQAVLKDPEDLRRSL